MLDRLNRLCYNIINKGKQKQKGDKKMTAYVEIYNKGTKEWEKHEWTLKEAKERLSQKDFERICDFKGYFTTRIKGYVG